MNRLWLVRDWSGFVVVATGCAAMPREPRRASEQQREAAVRRICSRRPTDCIACHNGLRTPSGEDVSIGASWRASMMANSARDPYWQAAVRRETIDHPPRRRPFRTSAPCATCRWRAPRRTRAGREGEVFAHLPVAAGRSSRRSAGARRRVVHASAIRSPARSSARRRASPAATSSSAAPPLGKSRAPPTRGRSSARSRSTRGCTARDALGDGVPPDRGGAHPAVRAVRHVPHALHESARRKRRGDRRAPRADAVSRMAAQRVPR